MSQITGGIPFVVDGPVPAPPLYNLLDTVDQMGMFLDDPADPHWQNGVSVYPYPPDLPSVWDGCGDAGTFIKADGEAIPLPLFSAYQLYFPVTCSMRGIDPSDISTWQDRARAAIAATQSYALEKEIAQGNMFPLNPFFTDTNMDDPAGATAVSPRIALSYLEDAIGQTGRLGLIHATPGSVAGFSLLDVSRDRDGLFSAGGTQIVRGTGYLNSVPVDHSTAVGPGTAFPKQAWAFATGPLKIIGGPILGIPDTPAQALNRGNNIYTFFAERNFVVYWDTELQAGVLVDWSLTP